METPALDQLFGGYFHQDWSLDHPDRDAVIRAFAVGEPDLAPLTGDEVRLVLGRLPSEEAVGAFMLDAGSCVDVSRRGESHRTWLRHIADVVSEAAVPTR